ncbi:hypothetical protein [Serratia marcescens]|uniref:hypothetical protein n=1 Tax=Serratia marcescens TaxID=615 RepID=UPI0006ECDCB5|nr:hypothetical protein [Serratia marcescens]ALL38446.1 hypothetical protein AR325_16255 [Serratia marcescens]PHI52190.1 hypothetical protein B9T65_06670 [Serratia marcescens]UJA52125.1 hypothetical protein L1F17_13945 [Serratia marcescens]
MTDTDRSNKTINIKELKDAFKEGAIPNEQDYGNLIDLAVVGALAPKSRLTVEGNKLAVNLSQTSGLGL